MAGQVTALAKSAISNSNNNNIKFTLYNLAGKEKAYYVVDRVGLTKQQGAIAKKPVAHSIIIIDRSGSMSDDIQALKETLIKLLTLDEYINFQLVVSLISYSSIGDLTCHFERVPIQEVMKQNSPYLEEIRKIDATYLTCISQAMDLAKSLIKDEELTAITLHSDGYANDSSPSAEVRAIEAICKELQTKNVFVNTIAYSDASDFKLLSKIANSVFGLCVQAGNVKEVYDAIYSTSKLIAGNLEPTIEESLAADCAYQVFVSKTAKKINGASGTLKICGLQPNDNGVIYKYKQVDRATYEKLQIPIAQNHEAVYAFAKANLVEGNLNTAKYAIASSFDATLTAKHAKALTNGQIADFAQDIDIAIFYPNVLPKHEILSEVKVNEKISILELIQLLTSHRNSLIVNLKHLQDNYQRKGIKRVQGVRDASGNLIQPWLRTSYIDNGQYVDMGTFEINRNTATINMLVTRRVKLVKASDKTPIIEVAGLLINDLIAYNNYTIVSDGELNVKSLQVKISNKKTYDALKQKGVIAADKFDFRSEYTINLEELPLVPLEGSYSSIDGLFEELASVKVLASIIAAHVREESDTFLPEQLEDLKKHYISKNLYVNFPTTNEYSDIQTALATGVIDSRISYKIDIGSKDILNLGKLHSANKFLDRMYEAIDMSTGEIFVKPTFDIVFRENISFRHKQLSSRVKITKVDEFMKAIFDDFLGLENNGSVAAILEKVGADVLQINSDRVSKEEVVSAFTVVRSKLDKHAEKLYQEKISPLVFYIGATGLLPDEMEAKAMTADELMAKYPNLQFSKDEKEGTFFEVGDTIISVYAQTEYYTKKVRSCASAPT